MKVLRAWILLALLVGQGLAEQLKLPATSIGLDTPAGQQLLLESASRADYWPLAQGYETQSKPSHCGPASSVMVLNALKVPAPASATHEPFRQFDQDNFFSDQAEKVLSEATLSQQGATLDELAAMLGSWGTEVQVVHAAADGLPAFRQQARAALGSGRQFVIINFHRDPLNQLGGSHFSPLAAYHEASDRFLVLDVARFRYPPFWVTAEQLFSAMNTVDSVSQQTRGYLLIQARK